MKCGNELTYRLDNANTIGGESFLWDSDILVITQGETAAECKVMGGDYDDFGHIYCTVTACGIAKTATFNVRLICEIGLLLQASPNPSTGETTIELVSENEKVIPENIEWSLEIYDPAQSLKTKVPKVKGSKQTINTSGWKEGTYFIRAQVGEEWISEKLIVSH